MSVPEHIATFALRALDDPDALPVLGDMVLESGWVEPWPLARRKPNAGRPTRHWALRIVAYAMFGSWPKVQRNGRFVDSLKGQWPVVGRCLVEPERVAFYANLVVQPPGHNWRITL